MEKLNPVELEIALQDIRKAYRLIAIYQERIKDIINYCGNHYGMAFSSGWSKFSSTISGGKRAKIDKTSWSWLPMYFYEFNMGVKEINNNTYHFKILHQADTGFYDAQKSSRLNKMDTDKFGQSDSAESRFYFILSKNKNGCPINNLLKNHRYKNIEKVIFDKDWLAVVYPLQNFMNEKSTLMQLKVFDSVCLKELGVSLLIDEKL